MRKWEIDTTLIDAWMEDLNEEEYEHLIAALEYLGEHGPTAGRPFVDTLEGSKHPNMKELRPRPTTGGVYMRALFAFDLQSRAIMLVAGDKAGNWSKWYSTNIPIADDLLTEHQDKLREKLRDTTTTGKPSKTRKKGKKR
ncbi:type II toxin-antitoxin system RelE/ParE family toxin [Mycobacterium riyadhense]|uniref:type II toxin-antitoxin system RelE/ParE family toxin n=1 Tax=Mycobacterium riyadhense TaxID=486698 RepID=UPI001957B33D|nr:type II toxin-antitoxin system RelE/ParE family toxin [Mycobacterium riyadhense]